PRGGPRPSAPSTRSRRRGWRPWPGGPARRRAWGSTSGPSWRSSVGSAPVMSAVRAKVDRFVDELSVVLVELGSAAKTPPVPAERLRHDCAIEAFGIACSVLAGDGRLSDDELWELAAGFGTHLEGQIGGATPADIRT